MCQIRLSCFQLHFQIFLTELYFYKIEFEFYIKIAKNNFVKLCSIADAKRAIFSNNAKHQLNYNFQNNITFVALKLQNNTKKRLANQSWFLLQKFNFSFKIFR